MLKTVRNIENSSIVFLSLVGVILIGFWLYFDPVKDLSASQPGLDNRPLQTDADNEIVNIGEYFNLISESSSDLKGKWPKFRGADHDNINKESIPLINTFGENGPDVLWQIELGEGHAAPAIYNGMVYLLDYNELKKIDVLRCLDLKTGKELWRRSYSVHIKRNHGMSRTVPAVNEKFIVTIGPRGHVMCVERESGNFLWGIDMVKEYKSEIPFWYTGQCPIIENNTAILAPGGSSLIIAVDCQTGKVLWETPNPGGWKMSHSSIVPMDLNGQKTYIYAAIGGICGVKAEGEQAGEVIWKTTEFAPNVVAPSPVVMGNDLIFMTAGYGAGAFLFKLVTNKTETFVEILQKYKPSEGIASEQQTPVLYNNRMFAILPKDAGSARNQFVCVNPVNCKQFLWTSGKTERFGLGPYIVADDKFYILNDDGTLIIAEATANGFKLLDKARIIDGQDAWGPIAIADGYLIMRDSKQMVCLNIKK